MRLLHRRIAFLALTGALASRRGGVNAAGGTIDTQGLSECALACIGVPQDFCVNLARVYSVDATKQAFSTCVVSNQCSDLGTLGPTVLGDCVQELCFSLLDSDRSLLGVVFFGLQDVLYTTPQRRDIVIWVIVVVNVTIFLPIYIHYRNQRMVRHKHWPMSVFIVLMLVLFMTFTVFFWTVCQDVRNINLSYVRAWTTAHVTTLLMSMHGLHALMVTHYFQAKVQSLRMQLQSELPMIFRYHAGGPDGETANGANSSTTQSKSRKQSRPHAHTRSTGSTGQHQRSTDDETMMRYAGEATSSNNWQADESSRLGLSEIAEDVNRSATSALPSMRPTAVMYATQESVTATADRLRRAHYWARPHMAWVFFFISGVPSWGFLIWGFGLNFWSPHLTEYITWISMVQSFMAILLLFGLRIPWLPADNFYIKYQLIIAIIGITINFVSYTINHYSPSDSAQAIIAWSLGLTLCASIFSLIIFPSCMCFIPSARDSMGLRAHRPNRNERLISAGSGDELETQQLRPSSRRVTITAIGHAFTEALASVRNAVSLSRSAARRGEKEELAGKAQSSASSATTAGGSYAAKLNRILDTRPDTDPGSHPVSVKPPQLPAFATAGRISLPPLRTGGIPTAPGAPSARSPASLNPTYELEMTLANPTTLAALSQFCAHEYCVETILFLSAAEDYRSSVNAATAAATRAQARSERPPPSNTGAADARLAWATHIVESFITPGSINEINLPSSTRTAVETSFGRARAGGAEQLPGDLFEECAEHVKYMLATDIMPRYRRSRFYVPSDADLAGV
ncbi:hypothetical protein HDU87_003902 [Geranomyces variabilis]|uniref:RGS domain-containing protein n=1 Tax=Geranomyces variabilis TaxID=109894 RepID=A0AAD5TQS4_9FUNG|nr:hypothetical protein HDU87_003902 [Geranomyces variabilis]